MAIRRLHRCKFSCGFSMSFPMNLDDVVLLSVITSVFQCLVGGKLN